MCSTCKISDEEKTRNQAVARQLDKYLKNTKEPRNYKSLAKLFVKKVK